MSSTVIQKIFENEGVPGTVLGAGNRTLSKTVCFHEVYNLVEKTVTKCPEGREHHSAM